MARTYQVSESLRQKLQNDTLEVASKAGLENTAASRGKSIDFGLHAARDVGLRVEDAGFRVLGFRVWVEVLGTNHDPGGGFAD